MWDAASQHPTGKRARETEIIENAFAKKGTFSTLLRHLSWNILTVIWSLQYLNCDIVVAYLNVGICGEGGCHCDLMELRNRLRLMCWWCYRVSIDICVGTCTGNSWTLDVSKPFFKEAITQINTKSSNDGQKAMARDAWAAQLVGGPCAYHM